MPLKLPPGFSISIYASGLTGARVLKPDILPGSENLLVSLTSAGKVVVLKPDLNQDGKSDATMDLITGLNQPHGIEIANCSSTSYEHPIYPCRLYIAETNQVSVFDYSGGDNPKVENKRKMIDLPSGSGHFTRSLLVTPDFKRLLISVGSSCNVCDEKDWRRAKILSANLDGSDLKVYASGLRNAVFMEIRSTVNAHLSEDQVWVTEMGRDLLGDDIPPDEINIITADQNYGWPLCYGRQVTDPFNRDKKDCSDTESSHIDLQAHSAPLGLAFIPEKSAWPQDYWGDLLIAYHGSWNRSVPTGYKIVRIRLDEQGNSQGIEDFITGWLVSNKEALGRPVDILVNPDGSAFISDDKAGVVYKLSYTGSQ